MSARYYVFSVTGFDKPISGGGWNPKTTWYVADDLRAGLVLHSTPYEHEARNLRWKLSALDREYEKRQERKRREQIAGRNGHP